MGHNGVWKQQKCLDKITEGGGSVMNTERFIDQNLKLVNNHHNRVMLLWPMLIWTVCFKCSLDACTPFSKWMEDFFSTQQYCYLPASNLSEKIERRLDVSFTVKTQKLLFYFCLKWGRFHTGWKHPTVSGARVYPNHFIRCCALERWRMSQMTWIFVCFCKACNYGTVVWRSERMDDAVCHTAMSHSWPWLRCGLDQGFQRLQIQIRAGLLEQVQSTEARLVSMTQSIHRQHTRHAQHDAWRSFCGWHWGRKLPQLLIWGFFWPQV